MKPDWYDIPSKREEDPDIPNLHLFESEFQKFMRGEYAQTLDEDWERAYFQRGKVQVHKCEHGKNPAFCNKCYFSTK